MTGPRSSSSTTSPRSTERAPLPWPPCGASACPSTRASTWPSWARRARASPRSCTSWAASTSPAPARYRLAGENVGDMDETGAGLGAQPPDRLRLPAVQPAALPDRLAQRRAAPRLRRGGSGRTPGAGASAALDAGRAGRPGPTPSRRAVRRPAAAGGHRPGPGQRPRPRSWPTSRPGPSTRRRPPTSWPCSTSCTRPGRTLVLITHDADVAGGRPAHHPPPRRADRPSRAELASMSWLDTLRTGLEAVRTHRLRSGLTVLGIMIGIAAVILTVGLGQGAQDQVSSEINALGHQPADRLAGQLHVVERHPRRLRLRLDPHRGRCHGACRPRRWRRTSTPWRRSSRPRRH